MVSTSLIFLGTVTGIAAALTAYGAYKDGTDHPMFIVGVILLLAILFLGWGVYGTLCPVYEMKESISNTALEIQHMSDRVVVKYGDTVEVFTDVKNYDVLKGSFVCTLVTSRNMYGFIAPDQTVNTLHFYPAGDTDGQRD